MNQQVFSNPDQNQNYNRYNRDQFYLINGYVSYIKNDEKSYYLACPEESCRRKVNPTSSEPQMYHCDHCNKTYDHCKPTFMLLCKISDLSENVYINFYRE